VTCADLIRGNPRLQEAFAQLQVISVLDDSVAETNTKFGRNRTAKVYVIDGLLNLTLRVSYLQAFNARAAACECIKAYFYSHPAIRLHFLRRAIECHASGTDNTANILTVLLRPADQSYSIDPYRPWLAAILLFHLIFEDIEAKHLAMGVAEGNASNGEEVVTCIQSVAAHLITAMQNEEDDRVLIGFLMLLCVWLFEDPDAVNDFLGEVSNVHCLMRAILQGDRGHVVVQGLCAVLLGIVYEFSTKDSPTSRTALHSILSTRLGRDQYIDRLTKLRRHPLLRDFEILPQKLSTASLGGLPEVYFDKTFVDFIKDNFSRLLRSIDRDPVMEMPVNANGIHKGISREMVDSLRSQLDEKDSAFRRAEETATLEMARIKNVNDALQRHHEDEIR
jgi:intracellular protein transport protein USO1